MLPVSWYTIRIFLHVLAAAVWVGGQLTLAFLVPTVRTAGVDTTRAVARRFQLLAWPAFAVLLATGVWNLWEAQVSSRSSEWIATLSVKLLLVAVSGLGAALHAFVTGPAATAAARDRGPTAMRRHRAISAATAAIGLFAALAATFLGVML